MANIFVCFDCLSSLLVIHSQNNWNSSILRDYPAVANAFIKAKSTLLSSAVVERLFSAGQILIPRRCSLSDDHFDWMVFVRDRLKNKSHVCWLNSWECSRVTITSYTVFDFWLCAIWDLKWTNIHSQLLYIQISIACSCYLLVSQWLNIELMFMLQSLCGVRCARLTKDKTLNVRST